MKNRFILVLAVAIAGCASSGGTSGGSADAPRDNVMIRFTDMSVQPRTARVKAGGSVVWTNMASEFNGVISFPLSTESSFTCTELRPYLSRTATRLVSKSVAQDSDDVTLPCPLKPGEYDYQVDLFRGMAGGGMDGMDNPQRTLDGKIIVE